MGKRLLLLQEKIKGLAMFILRRLIVPLVLFVLYFFGVGATKVLMVFSGNPLFRRERSDSFWKDSSLGTGGDDAYHHQS